MAARRQEQPSHQEREGAESKLQKPELALWSGVAGCGVMREVHSWQRHPVWYAEGMPENFRRFRAGPDPFGRTWEVEFQWLQTGISIRHADTVDVKYYLWTSGEPKQEKVVALPHADLLALSKEAGRPLTDAWCMRLAGGRLAHMIESAEDMEKTLVTVSSDDLKRAAGLLQPA